MRRNTRRYFAAATVAVVLSAAGCTEGPVGIFAGIESEVRRDIDLGLADQASVNAVFRTGDRYVNASGRVYRRSATATSSTDAAARWEAVVGPTVADLSYTRSIDAVPFGGQVYAVFSTDDGTSAGLFRADLTQTSPSWTQVDLSALSNLTLVGDLHVVNVGGSDELFFSGSVAETQSDGSRLVGYALYRSTDGTTFTQVLARGPLPIDDIAHDGTSYWAVSSRAVYRGATAAGLAAVSPTIGSPADLSLPAGTAYRGLYYGGPSGNQALYLTTSVGYLLRWNGASFDTTAAPLVTSTNTPIAMTDVVYVSHSGFSGLLVGTEGSGYYVLKDGDDADSQIDLSIDRLANLPDLAGAGGNYLPSGLSSSTVLAFFVDPSPVVMPIPDAPETTPDGSPLVFAGTAGSGLWRNYYYRDATLWVRE